MLLLVFIVNIMLKYELHRSSYEVSDTSNVYRDNLGSSISQEVLTKRFSSLFNSNFSELILWVRTLIFAHSLHQSKQR